MLKNIILTQEQVFGSDRAILVSFQDTLEYVEGKATGKRLGTRYNVVCPATQFELCSVKVPDDNVLTITQDELDERNARFNFQFVRFENFSGKIWQEFESKKTHISGTASKIVLLNDKKEELK